MIHSSPVDQEQRLYFFVVVVVVTRCYMLTVSGKYAD